MYVELCQFCEYVYNLMVEIYVYVYEISMI